jgi:hypothetical protein
MLLFFIYDTSNPCIKWKDYCELWLYYCKELLYYMSTWNEENDEKLQSE